MGMPLEALQSVLASEIDSSSERRLCCRRGRSACAAARRGGALRGTFDEQTWSTLVELGAAPTPVHGQIGCYKTPRELKPSAATPPLIHSAAGLAGKQTPCSGPAGAPGRRASSGRKRSIAEALASAAEMTSIPEGCEDDQEQAQVRLLPGMSHACWTCILAPARLKAPAKGMHCR